MQRTRTMALQNHIEEWNRYYDSAIGYGSNEKTPKRKRENSEPACRCVDTVFSDEKFESESERQKERSKILTDSNLKRYQ